MQTSRAGRSAETDDIALTVTPASPPGPSVVTTLTVAAARLMPSRKRSRSIGQALLPLLLAHHPIGQTGRLLDELQRLRPVEAAVDRIQMRERRRLREQLEGHAVPGIVGVQEIAGEGQKLAPILRHPVLVHAVVLLEQRLGLRMLERS